MVLWGYVAFTSFDLLYALMGFLPEKKKKKTNMATASSFLFNNCLPIPSLLVVLKSLSKAIEGTDAVWNKVKKNRRMPRSFPKYCGTSGERSEGMPPSQRSTKLIVMNGFPSS